MAKGVLGNDPFQRGAASRSGDATKPGASPGASEEKASASDNKKKAQAPSASRPASRPERKHAADKSRPGKPATRGKPAPAKAAGGTKASASRSADRAKGSTSRDSRSANGAKPSPSRDSRNTTVANVSASRDPRSTTGAKPHQPSPPREPVPRSESSTTRTPHQREVDHALAEALAAEVAEVTAKHAVDVAMDRHPGNEEAVDRLLATELTTELAEAAVEEALDHSPTTQRPDRERSLATTVAAQVAESVAEAAVAEVLERRAEADNASRDPFEERAADITEDDLDEEERSDLELVQDLEQAGGALAFEDDDDGATDDEKAAWVLAVEQSRAESPDTSSVEPEVELPDGTADEIPLGRRSPLSLVPSSEDTDAAGQAPRTGGSPHEQELRRPLAERATSALSLAREIAGQALASEGLGRAWGAMSGLMEAVRAGLGTGGGAHLDEYGKDPSLVQRLDPVLEFLYGQYWRVSAQGTDLVPRGAVILVANHSGALPYDGLVMSLTMARERPDLRESRWLVEDQIFHAPVLGTLFNRLGAVRACPENALRLLDEQRPLVVFPEGYQGLSKPFAERYRLKRFGRGGFVKLALRTGAPILPVAIVGAEETSPLLGRIPASFLGLPYLPLTPLGPLPAKWSIRFGDPISMDGLPSEAADDLGEVQRLTERTREAIQGMIHTLLRERRSVFAG